MRYQRAKLKFVFSQRIPWVGFGLLLLMIGSTGCSSFMSFQTNSDLPKQKITIDGKTDDWVGELYVVPAETLNLGFLNDRENLYLCLVAEDRATRAQIMMQGLIVWFNPQGKKEKVFGIKYPVGIPPGDWPKQLGPGQGDEFIEDYLNKNLTQLEILGSEKEKVPPQKMEVSEAKGIEIKVVPSTGMLVYELKIPLQRTPDHPIAVGADPGQTVAVGFETPEINPKYLPKGMSEMPPGGGRRPPMGGGYGPGRMGGYGPRPGMLNTLKFWAIVQTASSSGQSPVKQLAFSR
jgi:hypothetical protein